MMTQFSFGISHDQSVPFSDPVSGTPFYLIVIVIFGFGVLIGAVLMWLAVLPYFHRVTLVRSQTNVVPRPSFLFHAHPEDQRQQRDTAQLPRRREDAGTMPSAGTAGASSVAGTAGASSTGGTARASSSAGIPGTSSAAAERVSAVGAAGQLIAAEASSGAAARSGAAGRRLFCPTRSRAGRVIGLQCGCCWQLDRRW